jgi:hypothetical protein
MNHQNVVRRSIHGWKDAEYCCVSKRIIPRVKTEKRFHVAKETKKERIGKEEKELFREGWEKRFFYNAKNQKA